MSPHVAAKRAELLTKETELRDGVLAAAKDGKVPLPALLDAMRQEAGVQPKTQRPGNDFVHGLFTSGAMDGLTRN